jgi:S1-C subfamily serine protease
MIIRRRILTVVALAAMWVFQGVPAGAQGPPRDHGRMRREAANGKNEPAVRSAFQEVLGGASAATVRVLADGEQVALGAVVESDGYLVTKASVLKGKITCRFKDGTERTAEKVGEDGAQDLALLRVEARGLTAISWRQGDPPPPGSLVAATASADAPIAIGVVSTDPRIIRGRTDGRHPRAWLGVEMGGGESGLGVGGVMPDSPAAKAGVRAGDEIRQIDGAAMKSAEQIVEAVAGHRAGQTIKLLVHRQDQDLEISATLARFQSPQDAWGGGPFSERRSGFPAVLPHDAPLHPRDCGGPLVDTDGRAVGINIARALRVTTYALPADVVRNTVSALKDAVRGTTQSHPTPPK